MQLYYAFLYLNITSFQKRRKQPAMQTLNHDLYSVGHLDTGKLINILETPDENIIIRKQQYK